MGWSKREFISQAFEAIGLSSSVFDLSAEQLQSGLRILDSMMATWNARGIRLGYPIPASPDGSDLDEASSVPDAANEAIYTNLALRLAPTIGKTVSVDLKIAAKQAYDELLSRAAMPPEQQMPSGVPAGAGQKTWRSTERPFLDDPTDTLDAGSDSELDFD